MDLSKLEFHLDNLSEKDFCLVLYEYQNRTGFSQMNEKLIDEIEKLSIENVASYSDREFFALLWKYHIRGINIFSDKRLLERIFELSEDGLKSFIADNSYVKWTFLAGQRFEYFDNMMYFFATLGNRCEKENHTGQMCRLKEKLKDDYRTFIETFFGHFSQKLGADCTLNGALNGGDYMLLYRKGDTTKGVRIEGVEDIYSFLLQLSQKGLVETIMMGKISVLSLQLDLEKYFAESGTYNHIPPVKAPVYELIFSNGQTVEKKYLSCREDDELNIDTFIRKERICGKLLSITPKSYAFINKKIQADSSSFDDVFSDKRYGGYQVDVTRIVVMEMLAAKPSYISSFAKEPDEFTRKRARTIINIVRKYYPNATDRDIKNIAYKYSITGCGYMDIANKLCDYFSNLPNGETAFMTTFGFSLFENAESDRVYNFEALALELFLRYSRDIMKLKSISALLKKGSGTPSSDNAPIRSLLAEYGIYTDYKITRISRDILREYLIEQAANSSDSYLSLASNDFYLHLQSNSDSPNSDMHYFGMHAMAVCEIDAENIYVSSWGKKWSLNFEQDSVIFIESYSFLHADSLALADRQLNEFRNRLVRSLVAVEIRGLAGVLLSKVLYYFGKMADKMLFEISVINNLKDRNDWLNRILFKLDANSITEIFSEPSIIELINKMEPDIFLELINIYREFGIDLLLVKGFRHRFLSFPDEFLDVFLTENRDYFLELSSKTSLQDDEFSSIIANFSTMNKK